MGDIGVTLGYYRDNMGFSNPSYFSGMGFLVFVFMQRERDPVSS